MATSMYELSILSGNTVDMCKVDLRSFELSELIDTDCSIVCFSARSILGVNKISLVNVLVTVM